MARSPAQLANLKKGKRFKPGKSGNPAGKPKGTLNWSTVVKDVLADPGLIDKVIKKEQQPEWLAAMKRKDGATIIAISMIIKAASGDKQAADWLRKTGWGDKINISAAKTEEVAAAVEELAAQDDNVGQRAADQLAEMSTGQVVETEPSVQDQEQGRPDPDVSPEHNPANVPQTEGQSPVQPDTESPAGGDNNSPSS